MQSRYKRRKHPKNKKMNRQQPQPQLTTDYSESMPTLVITRSTELLEQTARVCQPFLAQPTPLLTRDSHVTFLTRLGLMPQLPRPFVALDASRPWMMYWTLCALKILGEDITPHRERAISSLKACRHPDGGFGGGHGQLAHLAPTYAAVNTLALFGGDDAYEIVDRNKTYEWMMSLKQKDGGFLMHHGGEEDARSAYTALSVATLLNIRTDELVEGTAEWLVSCQTFEGGISGSPTSAEAHGGYAFCILAALCLLHPPTELGKYLDMDNLIRWVAMQQAPEGGFSGRTNKLVDACYSWWVGGCWSLIEAYTQRPPTVPSIWNREGLVKYLLSCCQHQDGGLRDKPPMRSDFYHTMYSLSGLSATQYHYIYDSHTTNVEGDNDPAFKWIVSGEPQGDEGDRVEMIHPIFVLPWGQAEKMRQWFLNHEKKLKDMEREELD